jgi:UDP-glucose 4-epimerase
MTVLITGGMGFIGLHAAKAFLDAGQDVVITYYQTWRDPSFIRDEYDKRVVVEKADVSEPSVIEELAKKHKAEHLVHLAVPGVAALGPYDDYRVNMNGLIGVLEAARNAEVKRLSFASSIAVYHSIDHGPYSETDRLPVESSNPTETFKKAWEILAFHYAARTGLDVVSMRIGGIWGPLYHSMMNLPSRLAHAAVGGTEPDYSRGVPFAEDTGDVCYVKDCAEGIKLVQLTDNLEHRIYNVSSGLAVPNQQLVDAVKAVKPDANLSLQAGKGPAYKEQNYLDMTRSRDELGFANKYTPESAMADYIAWLEEGNAK